MNKKSSNLLFISIVAVLAFGIGIWLGLERQQKSDRVIVQDRVITVLPKPKDLEPFKLVTAGNKPFTRESILNRYTLFFFGYTSCPDVCPTTLQVLGNLYKKLERDNRHRDVQIVFVSVDPKRDKPAALKKYVEYFNKDFVGVSGSESAIATFARQLGAAYQVLDDGRSDNYDVNHTGLLFVTNPRGQYAAILSPPHEVELIESRMKLLKQLEQR